MKKILIVLFMLTFVLLSCKKYDLEDKTVYRWKKDLVSDVPLNPNYNSKDSSTTYYVVSTEFVFLTNAQMKEQEKAKRKDGTTFHYIFTKA